MPSKYWQYLLTCDAGFYVYKFQEILFLIILLSVRQYQYFCIHFVSVFLDRKITLTIYPPKIIFFELIVMGYKADIQIVISFVYADYEGELREGLLCVNVLGKFFDG